MADRRKPSLKLHGAPCLQRAAIFCFLQQKRVLSSIPKHQTPLSNTAHHHHHPDHSVNNTRYVTARARLPLAAVPRHPHPSIPSHHLLFQSESERAVVESVRLRAILRRRRRRRVHTPSLHHTSRLTLPPTTRTCQSIPSPSPNPTPVLPPSHRSRTANSTHPESLIHFCLPHHRPFTLLPPHHTTTTSPPLTLLPPLQSFCRISPFCLYPPTTESCDPSTDARPPVEQTIQGLPLPATRPTRTPYSPLLTPLCSHTSVRSRSNRIRIASG